MQTPQPKRLHQTRSDRPTFAGPARRPPGRRPSRRRATRDPTCHSARKRRAAFDTAGRSLRRRASRRLSRGHAWLAASTAGGRWGWLPRRRWASAPWRGPRGRSPVNPLCQLMFALGRDRPMPCRGIVTLATFTCQPREAVIGRRLENQWLGELQRGTGPLQNPLFLANVTMPLEESAPAEKMSCGRQPCAGDAGLSIVQPPRCGRPAQPPAR